MDINTIEFIVYDVETTGLSPLRGDRIIEIAAVKLKNKQIIDTFETFLNPQRLIPEEASRINHITDEMVSDAPKAIEVLPDIIDFIGGGCLVAHNVKFDLDFLCYELASIGRKLNENIPAVDTLKMARRYLPHLGSFKLGKLTQNFGIINEDAHRALADVKATAAVLIRLLEMGESQGHNTFKKIIKEFGVNKPNFKIQQLEQASLF